jgi:hypothetical protein
VWIPILMGWTGRQIFHPLLRACSWITKVRHSRASLSIIRSPSRQHQPHRRSPPSIDTLSQEKEKEGKGENAPEDGAYRAPCFRVSRERGKGCATVGDVMTKRGRNSRSGRCPRMALLHRRQSLHLSWIFKTTSRAENI